MVEFLISSGHLPSHVGIAYQDRHDNSNKSKHTSLNRSYKIQKYM